MKKANFTLAKGLGAALLCVGANVAFAETVTVPATVTVNNAIDFTFTGSLDFGQVRASADDTDLTCAGLRINPQTSALTGVTPAACSAGAGTAVIQAIGGTAAVPTFTIAGTAAFAELVLTLPNNPQFLTAAGPGTPPGFFLSAFTAHQLTGASTGPISLTAGVGDVQTSGTGNATFTVGADLGTHLDDTISTESYQDQAYTGSFDVTVTY